MVSRDLTTGAVADCPPLSKWFVFLGCPWHAPTHRRRTGGTRTRLSVWPDPAAPPTQPHGPPGLRVRQPDRGRPGRPLLPRHRQPHLAAVSDGRSRRLAPAGHPPHGRPLEAT